MRKAVLIKILKKFSPKDIKAFRKFLQSPYHTETKLLLEFFDYLRRFHPNYTSNRLKKEHLFQLFFSDKDYTKTEATRRLSNMTSQLKQLVEEFLIMQEFKKDKFLRKRMLAKAYYKTSHYGLFKSELEDALKSLEKMKYKNENYYLEKLLLYQLEFHHPQTFQKDKNGNTVKALMHYLNEFFILQKLYGGMDLVTRKKNQSKEYHIQFLDEILQLIKDEKKDDNPRFQLYYLIIQIFQNPFSEENYFKLKNKFLHDKINLTKLEQRNVWSCLSNYYSYLIRENNDIDKHEIWELQKIGLDDEILIQNNRIKKEVFENIVVVSCFLKKFTWTKKFIEEYSTFLDVEGRNNTVTLSWTYYYFYQNDFEQVISLLREIEFTNHHYKSRTRSLLLRSYYELIEKDDDYYEAFLSLSQSFEKFLRRDKRCIGNYQKAYLNFIILIRLLAKIKLLDFRKQDYQEIIEKMKTMEFLVARPWFEEKILNFYKRKRGE